MKTLPKTLDETYERILVNIDEMYREDVQKVLQFLAFSARPVSLDEVVEVLAVTFEGSPRFDPEQRYPEPRDILTRCSSLVSISVLEQTRPKDQLRLAHFSVKEYLVSSRIQYSSACPFGMTARDAHGFIARACLAYLLQFKTLKGLTEATVGNFPLAQYAAAHWMGHAQAHEGPQLNDLQILIMVLLQVSQAHYVNWTRLYDAQLDWRDIMQEPSTVTPPLYYTACGGMTETTRLLLEKGADINAQGGVNGNALQAASYERNNAIVQILLDNGADVNAQGGRYGNALQAASYRGNDAIVQILLHKGADVNAQGGVYGHALQAASYGGNDAIVQILLDNGADVNAQGGEYDHALQAASFVGNDAIVQILLDNGADVNALGDKHGNVL